MKYNSLKTGERIRAIREKENTTQETLAAEFHISRNTLSKIENGVEKDGHPLVTLKFLLEFSKWSNCDIGYLLGEYDEKTRTNADICKETGLDETAISLLKKWLSLGLGHYIDVPIKERTVKGQITCEYDKPTYIVNLLFNNPHIIGLIYLYLTLTDTEKSTVYQGDRSTTVLFELMHELRILRDNFQPMYKKELLKFYKKDGVNNGGDK